MRWAGLEARMVAYYLEDVGVIRTILKFILKEWVISIWAGMNYFNIEASLDLCDYHGTPSCIRTEYILLA
jgi:hypothetical protein